MFRKGDCANCTEIACFKVSSKTGSPVELLKSAKISVSRSVRLRKTHERQYTPPATIKAHSKPMAAIIFHGKARNRFGASARGVSRFQGSTRFALDFRLEKTACDARPSSSGAAVAEI